MARARVPALTTFCVATVCIAAMLAAPAARTPQDRGAANAPSAPPVLSGSFTLPARFATRADASRAGCRAAAVLGPGSDACVLTAFHDRVFHVGIYRREANGYVTASDLAIPSWFEGATLSLPDVAAGTGQWLAIETEGMRGTGLSQRVLLIIGWDGTRFRTLAAESLEYRCARSTSPADYTLHVRHTLERVRGAAELQLRYELTRDGLPIGSWSDRLRWSAAQFALTPFRVDTAVTAEAVAARVRHQIGRVRVYSAVQPLNPASGASRWMERSEVMDVLAPACAPSVTYLARMMTGKWGLDVRQPASAGRTADAALVVGVDATTLSVSRTGGARDVYHLDGTASAVSVGRSSGRATTSLDGERLVVTITVDGQRAPLRRTFRLDGRRLVVEESGGPQPTTAYYDKL